MVEWSHTWISVQERIYSNTRSMGVGIELTCVREKQSRIWYK